MKFRLKCKRVLAFIVTFILCLTLADYQRPLNVYGTQTDGNTTLVTKTATAEGDVEDRIYRLDFTADLKEILKSEKNRNPIDVILLIDMSTSMWAEVGDTGKTRLQTMKDVATSFVDELAAYSGESTLSIATYNYTSERISEPLTVGDASNVITLKDAINAVYIADEQPEGTNHDYGFVEAEKIWDEYLIDSENQKYIIFLTDGQPNPDNRDVVFDNERYPETYNASTKIKYYSVSEGIEKESYLSSGIKSADIIRDFCVRRVLKDIKDKEFAKNGNDIKVATVGFEIADDPKVQEHVLRLFNEVTNSDLDYQFWTDDTTTLASIFAELLDNFAEENSTFKRPIIIDYIAADFVPLKDDGTPISIDEARLGHKADTDVGRFFPAVPLSNSKVTSYSLTYTSTFGIGNSSINSSST